MVNRPQTGRIYGFKARGEQRRGGGQRAYPIWATSGVLACVNCKAIPLRDPECGQDVYDTGSARGQSNGHTVMRSGPPTSQAKGAAFQKLSRAGISSTCHQRQRTAPVRQTSWEKILRSTELHGLVVLERRQRRRKKNQLQAVGGSVHLVN